MIQFIFRWLQGYLKIIEYGKFSERFFNLCKFKNIQLWGIEKLNETYECYIKLKDFYKLKSICKKTFVKVKIIERKGFPFFVEKIKKRKSYCVGFICFVIAIYISSLYVWSIQIDGNKRITDDLVLNHLKKQNVVLGTSKKMIDCEMLVKSFRQEFEEIAWGSVYLDGTNLCIKIKENLVSESFSVENDQINDIVAKSNGKITEIITRSGIPKVKIGDFVNKGDLLITGVISVMNDNKEIVSENYVSADGDILAETIIDYADKIDSSHFIKIYDKKCDYKILFQLNNKLIELGFNDKGKNYSETHMEVLSLLAIKSNYNYQLQEKIYTMYEREEILKRNFEWFCNELRNAGVTILENNLKIIHDSKKSYASCTIRVEESIGAKWKIIDLSSENMLQ